MELEYVLLTVLCFACTAVSSLDYGKRSDDVDRLDALETLVQTQASTIQSLQARLTSLDNTNQQQDVTIQQQGVTIQQQGALIVQQGATLQSLQSSLNSMSTKQGLVAGFYADFGTKPYHHLNLTPGQPVIFNRVLTNVGNAYDQSTGVFTSPTSGLYIFHLHVIGGSHSNTTDLGIYKGNDAVAIAFTEGYQRDSDDQGSCTAVTHLNKGELVSAQYYYGVSVQGIYGSFLTSFSGMLIPAD